MTREELIDMYAMDRETHLSFAEYCFQKGKEVAIEEYKSKLKANRCIDKSAWPAIDEAAEQVRAENGIYNKKD